MPGGKEMPEEIEILLAICASYPVCPSFLPSFLPIYPSLLSLHLSLSIQPSYPCILPVCPSYQCLPFLFVCPFYPSILSTHTSTLPIYLPIYPSILSVCPSFPSVYLTLPSIHPLYPSSLPRHLSVLSIHLSVFSLYPSYPSLCPSYPHQSRGGFLPLGCKIQIMALGARWAGGAELPSPPVLIPVGLPHPSFRPVSCRFSELNRLGQGPGRADTAQTWTRRPVLIPPSSSDATTGTKPQPGGG